jgi:hypothetical protein
LGVRAVPRVALVRVHASEDANRRKNSGAAPFRRHDCPVDCRNSIQLRPCARASGFLGHRTGYPSLVGHAQFRDQRVSYDASAKTYFIPGSWVPLVVIMAVFFAKCAYAVMNTLNAAVISSTLFVVGVSAIDGVLSGYFAERALNLISLTKEI